MASIFRNIYIYKLGDIVKKYNNAYDRTDEMKPVDVNSKTYFNFNEENNNKDPKFKVSDSFLVI